LRFTIPSIKNTGRRGLLSFPCEEDGTDTPGYYQHCSAHMAPPRKREAEIAWIRVIPTSEHHTGTIVRVMSSGDATVLTEGDANYFLGELRDDPRGYDYEAVPVGTPSRHLIKTTGQHYLIRATRQEK
jgi:hypothetical protein